MFRNYIKNNAFWEQNFKKIEGSAAVDQSTHVICMALGFIDAHFDGVSEWPWVLQERED